MISAFCPSDAAHVLGLHDSWDREAAAKAAHLFAGRRTARGGKLAAGADEISRHVFDAVTATSAETLVDASLTEDGHPMPETSAQEMIRAAIRQPSALVRITLSVPIVALGAAATAYYGDVARRLNTSAVIPDHADVANAIGAVVGHIRVNAVVTISRPSAGAFRAHFHDGPKDFDKLADAVAFTERRLREDVGRQAEASGARNVEITIRRDENSVMLGDEEMFLEMKVSAAGVGRPSFAASNPPAV